MRNCITSEAVSDLIGKASIHPEKVSLKVSVSYNFHVVLQPGGAETRPCLMTWGGSKLRPCDCPREQAKQTFLGRDMLSAPLHCLPLRPSPWKQNKIFLINSRACANQTPQYSYSLMSSCDFCQLKYGLKGAILSSCHGGQEGPLTPRLPNYMCLSFHYVLTRFRSFSPVVLDVALYNLFHKTEVERIFPNSFYEASITEPDKGIIWKENCRPNISPEHRCKNLYKTLAKKYNNIHYNKWVYLTYANLVHHSKIN